MNQNNTSDNEKNVSILFAAYGVGEFKDKINEIKDDYLLYLFDKDYNLLDIVTPYEI